MASSLRNKVGLSLGGLRKRGGGGAPIHDQREPETSDLTEPLTWLCLRWK